MVMQYNYITDNNLENIQRYMYSKYYGMEFILEFFSICRKNFIEDDNIEQIEFEKYINSNTTKELAQIWCAMKRSEEDKQFENRIEWYIKKFEVSKKIYRRYTDLGKAIIKSGCDEYPAYILLELILLQKYEENKSLRYLNCILKLSDTIFSLKSQMNSELEKAISFIAKKELFFIQELLEHEKLIMKEG